LPDFFDFLEQVDSRYQPRAISLMNWRYHHIVEPIKGELDNATALDLAATTAAGPMRWRQQAPRSPASRVVVS
jgi:hypothetical protein